MRMACSSELVRRARLTVRVVKAVSISYYAQERLFFSGFILIPPVKKKKKEKNLLYSSAHPPHPAVRVVGTLCYQLLFRARIFRSHDIVLFFRRDNGELPAHRVQKIHEASLSEFEMYWSERDCETMHETSAKPHDS